MTRVLIVLALVCCYMSASIRIQRSSGQDTTFDPQGNGFADYDEEDSLASSISSLTSSSSSSSSSASSTGATQGSDGGSMNLRHDLSPIVEEEEHDSSSASSSGGSSSGGSSIGGSSTGGSSTGSSTIRPRDDSLEARRERLAGYMEGLALEVFNDLHPQYNQIMDEFTGYSRVEQEVKESQGGTEDMAAAEYRSIRDVLDQIREDMAGLSAAQQRATYGFVLVPDSVASGEEELASDEEIQRAESTSCKLEDAPLHKLSDLTSSTSGHSSSVGLTNLRPLGSSVPSSGSSSVPSCGSDRRCHGLVHADNYVDLLGAFAVGGLGSVALAMGLIITAQGGQSPAGWALMLASTLSEARTLQCLKSELNEIGAAESDDGFYTVYDVEEGRYIPTSEDNHRAYWDMLDSNSGSSSSSSIPPALQGPPPSKWSDSTDY